MSVQLKKKHLSVGGISVGITWLDGRVIFGPDKKHSNMYFGICHFACLSLKDTGTICMIAPLDFPRIEMEHTTTVSPLEDYCNRAFYCLNFKCPHNRFKKDMFIAEFADCGSFTLGLPQNLGDNPLWFNSGKWTRYFVPFIMSPEGGRLEFSEEKWLNRTQKIFNKE